MTLPVVFTPAAGAEVEQAFDWYEARQPGVGLRFAASLDSATSRIAANPHHYPIAQNFVRRAPVGRFPYSLYFRLLPDRIQVIACFHTSRDPAQWQRRL